MIESGLRAEGISVSFGGVRAVDEVSLVVHPGEILGIVGPNGSGKTTLLNALTGLVDAVGQAQLDRTSLDLSRPARIRRLGVLRLFQAPQAIPGLSALENVLLSTADRRGTGALISLFARPRMLRLERGRFTVAERALQLVGLTEVAQLPGELLTYGQRRLLDLARALAAQPVVIMLDEPSAGLNEVETKELGALLRSLRDEGLVLLVVDHKVDFLNDLCDRMLAMHQGRKIAEGTPESVWRDSQVIESYLGRAHA